MVRSPVPFGRFGSDEFSVGKVDDASGNSETGTVVDSMVEIPSGSSNADRLSRMPWSVCGSSTSGSPCETRAKMPSSRSAPRSSRFTTSRAGTNRRLRIASRTFSKA